MITKYQDFFNENNTFNGITSEELELLKKYGIENYSFNKETKRIDVDGNVDLSSKKLKNLPNIRFGTITGNFICSENKLTSLQYCPIVIGGNFSCSTNKITSLKYCPFDVNGNFICSDNELTSLQYCPSEVGGDFSCGYNKLTSLQYCPTTVNGDFRCHDNQLTSLQYCPTTVNGDFRCDNNDGIKNIADYPLSIIKGDITDIFHFPDILEIVKDNHERYLPFIENQDKIKFHQQIMRDDPSLIPLYVGTGIPVPKKSSFI